MKAKVLLITFCTLFIVQNSFSKCLLAKGELFDRFNFRHATKYYDSETGLYYYAMRYYNPETGRWINRDPIDEKGFQFLHGIKGDGIKSSIEPYTFVKNNPVSLWDYLGLKWNIIRDKKTYANACADSSKDTFKDLATMLLLNKEEYPKWANTNDAKPKIGKVYKVPNVFFVQYGPATWGEKNIFTDTIFNLRDIAFWQAVMADKAGYKVLFQDNVGRLNIRGALRWKGLYAYIYAGHGSSNLRDLPPGQYTNYGIAYLGLYACYTADSDKPKNIPPKLKKLYPKTVYKYNEWELNVSRLGYFVGYQGGITTFNMNSRKIKIHGARGK